MQASNNHPRGPVQQQSPVSQREAMLNKMFSRLPPNYTMQTSASKQIKANAKTADNFAV